MPFDLEPIVARRFFDDSLGFDPALTDAGAFLAAAFGVSDLALTCFFATTFLLALAGLVPALGPGFLDWVLAIVFTAFLIRAFFATFLATFAVETLLCLDTEAEEEEVGFFFNSFFFFEPSFEIDFELFLVTAIFALFFWRLESISLIPISFY